MSTTEPLNTAPIQLYLQQVKSADLSNAKEIKLPIAQAKVLAYTLGIVMARLNGDLEQLIARQNSGVDDVIQINMDGGNKW
jgi:hypothetical protein